MKSLEEIKEEIIAFDVLPSYEDAERALALMRENDQDIIPILLQRHHIFELFNKEFVSELAKFLQSLHRQYNQDVPIVEVCAGDGKLSYHLKKKGVKIIATDDYSLEGVKRDETLVEKLSHSKALRKYNPEIVIVSWIPNESEIGIEVIRYPSVKHLVSIGESGGCCGSDKTYKIAKYEGIEKCTKYSLSRTDLSVVGLFYKPNQATK